MKPAPRDFYTNPGQGHRRYNGDAISTEDIQRLREVPLVQHATGKCARCGSTLVTDPLPHACDPYAGPHAIDYGGGLL